MARNFKDLKKRMTVLELNRFCVKIAKEYAESDIFQAETHFTEEYDITPSCYRRAKEHAVTHYLVDDWTVNRMEAKSKANQARSCSYSKGKSSSTYYSRLRQERKEYCIWLMREFEASILTVSSFMQIHGIFDAHMFSAIVKEALIVRTVFPFEVTKEIQIRMMQDCRSETEFLQVCKFFNQIWSERGVGS